VLSNSCVNISQVIHAIFPEVWELKEFQSAKVTFKVTGNGAIACRPHTISYLSSIAPVSLSYTVCEILSLFAMLPTSEALTEAVIHPSIQPASASSQPLTRDNPCQPVTVRYWKNAF